MEKAELRQQLLLLRAQIPPKKHALWSEALCARVCETDAYRCAETLLCYAPVRSEPDLFPLYRRAIQEHKKLFFPRCDGNEMRFHRVSSLEELVPDRYGIPAPPETAPELSDFRAALCLCPALAADINGFRLGYGGGYYDRFLREHPTVKSMVLLFDSFFLADLPREEIFDVRVERVITPTEDRSFHEA